MLGIIKRDNNGELPADELIMFYHQEFVNALKDFGYIKSPPSLLDLNLEILKHGALIVLVFVCFVPLGFVDWSKISPEDMIGGDNERTKSFKRSLFEHPNCKKLIQREMKNWLHKGWV